MATPVEAAMPGAAPSESGDLPYDAAPFDFNEHHHADTSTTVPDAAKTAPNSLLIHMHRLDHSASKLPAFRFVDRTAHAATHVAVAGSHHPDQPDPDPSSPAGVHPSGPTGPLLGAFAAHHLPQNPPASLENSAQPTSSASASCIAAPTTPPVLPSSSSSSSSAAPQPVTTAQANCPGLHDARTASTSADQRSPHSTTSPVPRHSQTSPDSTHPTASASPPVTPDPADKSFAPSPIDNPIVSTPAAVAADLLLVATPAGASATASPRSQANADIDVASPSFYTPATTLPRTRRRPDPLRRASYGAPSPPPFASKTRVASTPVSAAGDWTHGHRALVLFRPANGTLTDENEKIPRRISSTSRPPISYRPPPSAPGFTATTPGRIPPIRSFRSSGSRKSSLPEMNSSSYRYYDDGADYRDTNHRDRSLRALEGRSGNDWSREAAPPDVDDEVTESENNTADIFMRIAREESSSSLPRPKPQGRGEEEPSNTVSRVVRRVRPTSGHYAASLQRPPTPPASSRRASDQQASSSRTRRAPEAQGEQDHYQEVSNQSSGLGRTSSKLDSTTRTLARLPSLKPSPMTPRTQSVLENSNDRNAIFARRPSTKTGEHSRSSSIRQPTGLSKSFTSSSTMSMKHADPPQQMNLRQAEASESSASTAAASTVWDELDELKSRIHRLELTGKLPKTSGAAISRTSDERPPTADTGATTLSGSPKRIPGAGAAQKDIVSLSSAPKEAQPLLRSALAKAKLHVSSEVYDAIAAAANDAASLSQLMGTTGQPGPISSGASTIGVGGSSTVTDRQLRKKTESICRSLTELCVALTEEGSQRKNNLSASRPQTRGTSVSRDEAPSSPPTMKVFTGRRSAGPDEPLPSVEFTSPRLTRLDKRATFNFTGVSSAANASGPRYASSVMGGDDTAGGRMSSLIVSRSRRGVTEETDDQGRKTSLLRTRRAVTAEAEDAEDPDETHRMSYAIAPRRVTTISRVSNIDEEPQVGSRAPSRAITEVGRGLRISVPGRESTARRPAAHEPVSASSAQPSRRLLTSALPAPGAYSSRLMTPTTPGSARRFLQISRQQQDEREDTSNITARMGDTRSQRYSIAGPQAPPSNSQSSNIHRKRHSGIPSISGNASNAGGYR